MLSKNYRSKQKYILCWPPESENRRNLKSIFEVILPLIFAAFTKTARVPGMKKSNGNTMSLKLPYVYYLPV